MSEQNLTPAAPQQSSGSAPAGSEQVGSAPTGSEQVGSAPTGSEQVGSAPETTQPGTTQPGTTQPETTQPETTQPGTTTGKSRSRTILTRIISAIVALAVVGGVWAFFNRNDPGDAAAGSCIANLPEVAPGEEAEANNARVVDCDSDEAAYRVEGRVDSVTLEQAQGDAICQPFAATEFRYYSIREGGTGYVLCLSQIKR